MKIATLFESLHGMLDEDALKPIINMKKDELEKYGLTIQDILETCEILSIGADRLYHDPKNVIYPFCYWDGFYYRELLTLNPAALIDVEEDKRFKAQKKLMHEYVLLKKWDYVLAYADKKVSFPVLSYIMRVADPTQLAELFIETYNRNEYGFDRISPDMVRKAFEHPPGDEYDIKQATVEPDDEGYYTIYRGSTEKSTTLDKAYSWTLRRDVAKFFATRFESTGIIYQGKVHKDKIKAYINGRDEEEVLVFPEDVIIDDVKLSILPPGDEDGR